MLDGIPAARLFDEVCKMFLAGFAVRAFELLAYYGLLEHLLPSAAQAIKPLMDSPGSTEPSEVRLLFLGLRGTDERVAQDKPVTPTFLFAVLLWPAIKLAHAAGGGAASETQSWYLACEQVIAEQQRRVAVPKRFTLPLADLVAMQPRFERREGRRALRLLDHPRFRAAYDFMLLRAAAGEADPALAEWWTHIQTLAPNDRIALVEQNISGAPSGRQGGEGGAGGSGAAGIKRRRRRRRPAAQQSPP
jgi:poly(A) polymerase